MCVVCVFCVCLCVCVCVCVCVSVYAYMRMLSRLSLLRCSDINLMTVPATGLHVSKIMIKHQSATKHYLVIKVMNIFRFCNQPFCNCLKQHT